MPRDNSNGGTAGLVADDPSALISDWEGFLQEYRFRDIEGVRSLLFAHPDLLPVLSTARKKLADIFPVSEFLLDLHHDDEGSSRLIVTVPTSLPLEEAYQRMEAFNEEWWLQMVSQVGGMLSFDLLLL